MLFHIEQTIYHFTLYIIYVQGYNTVASFENVFPGDANFASH